MVGPVHRGIVRTWLVGTSDPACLLTLHLSDRISRGSVQAALLPIAILDVLVPGFTLGKRPAGDLPDTRPQHPKTGPRPNRLDATGPQSRVLSADRLNHSLDHRSEHRMTGRRYPLNLEHETSV